MREFTFEENSYPTVWLGGFSNHWGHLLTDQLGRLWCARHVPKGFRCILYKKGGTQTQHVRDLIHQCEPSLLGRLSVPKTPILYRRAIVPIPTFQKNSRVYTQHGDTFVRRQDVVLSKPARKFEGSYYLSRRRLSHEARLLAGERDLVLSLAEKGVKEIFPELLSVQDQILLFNQADIIIGCQGSALHSGILSLSNTLKIFNIIPQELNPRYYLIDYTRDYHVTYVGGLRITNGRFDSKSEQSINLEETMSNLRECGAF